jgi:hypothetical protein
LTGRSLSWQAAEQYFLPLRGSSMTVPHFWQRVNTISRVAIWPPRRAHSG